MPKEKPSTLNPYWGALTPQELRKFDMALAMFDTYTYANSVKARSDYSKTSREEMARLALELMQQDMPSREKFDTPTETTGMSAYQLAQEGWSDLIHGRVLGTEEKERGITIAGTTSPEPIGFISGIKEVPGTLPEQQ